jgi:DNA repair exonuclease SbcCD ATPase subunit
VRITTLTVQNFLSFGEATFDFRDAGLVLVEGENRDDRSARSNGSGKSAMIDALVWCLFGKTLRGYENDEVVNRRVGDDCLVTVRVEDGKRDYEITRARRHSTHKNSLRVYCESACADMTGSSNAETQEVVEKLLGCSVRTFLSSVVFGQDSAYRFSSLTDKEQKEILDEVLGVERFAAACGAARANVNAVADRVVAIERDLGRAEDGVETARTEAQELRDKDESFEEERGGKLETEREKLRKAKEQVKKSVKADVDKLKLAVEKAQKNVATAVKAHDVERGTATEAKVMRAATKFKVDDLRAHVKRHDGIAADCPTCGQKIDAKKRSDVLADFREKLTAANKTLEKIDVTAAKIEERFAAAARDLRDANSALASAQKTLNESIGEAANVKSWTMRVTDHEKRIAELEKETNPYAALAKKAEARRDRHESEVKLLTEQLSAEEAKLKLAEFWVEAFGAKGLRSLLLDTSLPLLNDEAHRISRALTGGAISVEFSALSELKSGKTVDRFEVRVDNKHGAASYLGNSSGEKAKVDLCVGLALQKLVASRSSASFNVVFMDEVFDHLDSAAHERVVEVLAEIDKESVFVVSHDEDLKAWFPASITVVKENGFSTVES